MLVAAGDLDELVGTRPQLVTNVGDDAIEIAVAADQRREGLALDWL